MSNVRNRAIEIVSAELIFHKACSQRRQMYLCRPFSFIVGFMLLYFASAHNCLYCAGVLQFRTEFPLENSQKLTPTLSIRRLTDVLVPCRILSAASDRSQSYTPISGSSVPQCPATVIGLSPARCASISSFISSGENSGVSTLITKHAAFLRRTGRHGYRREAPFPDRYPGHILCRQQVLNSPRP